MAEPSSPAYLSVATTAVLVARLKRRSVKSARTCTFMHPCGYAVHPRPPALPPAAAPCVRATTFPARRTSTNHADALALRGSSMSPVTVMRCPRTAEPGDRSPGGTVAGVALAALVPVRLRGIRDRGTVVRGIRRSVTVGVGEAREGVVPVTRVRRHDHVVGARRSRRERDVGIGRRGGRARERAGALDRRRPRPIEEEIEESAARMQREHDAGSRGELDGEDVALVSAHTRRSVRAAWKGEWCRSGGLVVELGAGHETPRREQTLEDCQASAPPFSCRSAKRSASDASRNPDSAA